METIESVYRRSSMGKGGRFTVALTAAVGAVACFSIWSGASFAQGAFPDRPLRVIVPFPPGGSTDIVARVVSAKMGEGLGKTVIVENKPGAAGNVGTAEAAKALPDGYTMLFHIATTAVINPLVMKNLTYDPLKDL